MATPYIKNDGVNYKIQAGLPSAGVATLQFTDSASSPVVTVPNLTGTMALTTIATGTNALVTTDMAAGFRALDGLVMPNVLGYLTNTPPGSPANGDTYIIGAAPTGAWAGQGGKVTRYSTVAAAWEFYTPKNGWTLEANSARENYRYTGSAWEIYYQEGTWTPTLTGFTVTGSPVITGNFRKIGRLSYVHGRIDPSGGTVASTLSVSTIANPPFSTPVLSGVVAAWANESAHNGIGNTAVYMLIINVPTIAATSDAIVFTYTLHT